MLSIGARVSLRLNGPLARTTTRLLSTPADAARRKLAFERVRTRIRTSADSGESNDDTVMNTHRWIDEEDALNQHRALSTLNPAYLQHADYTSLSYQVNPSISFLPRTLSFPVRFAKKDGTQEPFPEGTRGFFYYYSAPHLPQMAGGVRFRITSSGHPSSFSKGFDLLHEGLPWQIPLLNIASTIGQTLHSILRDQLLNEGLVTSQDLDHCLATTSLKKRLDPRTTLYRLEQPFHYVWVIGKTEAKQWAYAYTFADLRAQFRPLKRPYTGSALAQFELSTLPEHAGTETVVMRITKMLKPPTCVLPDYDGHLPPPAEGELVRRPMGAARSARVQPWYCDVNGPSDSAAALRILVKNGRAR
ncbi:hypothetical protein C8R44DRAFT_788626 [Mycena epipterygia]|nr:hypothetical protein C8R44DRAFT_788626 [Mycena epipterygia]